VDMGHEIEAHLAEAYALAYGLTRNAADAEDAVSGAVVALLSRRGRYDPSRPFAPYFARSVVNAAHDLHRSARARATQEGKAMPTGKNGADERQRRETAAAVREAVGALPFEERAAVLLTHLQGLSQTDAAKALGVSQKTVSTRARRALERLRVSLAGAGLAGAALTDWGATLARGPLPASLAERVHGLVIGTKTTAATAAAASASAAAKGGIAMKIVAGIIAAGAVAAGVAMMGGGRAPEPLPAEKPAGPVKEHAHNQKYKLVPIMGQRVPKTKGEYQKSGQYAGVLNGPGPEAEYMSAQDLASDSAGNAYWVTSGNYCLVRQLRREDGRAVTLAGSATGHLDGPLSRARFCSWAGGGYSIGAPQVSRDGKHLFIREGRNQGLLRHIDREADMVTTLGKFDAVRDRTGDIYVLDLAGGTVPPGKGYKTMKIPKITVHGTSQFWVMDVSRGRLYNHARDPVSFFDLKTGKKTQVTVSKEHKGAEGMVTDASGPFMKRFFHCPIGISISPGGRYLYVGGGDSRSLYRLDLEKEYIHIFKRNPDGTCSFQDGHEKEKNARLSVFGSSAYFADDGSAVWGAQGIIRFVPVGGGR